jgi:hypothetical protein
MENTLTFDEEVNGWTSFHSYDPEYMVSLNGKFFSFKNGDLFLHNSKNVPRNNFYGNQFTSKVGVIFNDNPSTEKMFKNIMLEANKLWKVILKTNLTEGNISKEEFRKRRSRWFAFTRRNEDTQDMTSFNSHGIGNAIDVDDNKVYFSTHFQDTSVSVGDKVMQIQNDVPVHIGNVLYKNRTSDERYGGQIVMDRNETNPMAVVDGYCYAVKESRIEGGEIRGYFLRADLENDDTEFAELFAVTSNTAETYV